MDLLVESFWGRLLLSFSLFSMSFAIGFIIGWVLATFEPVISAYVKKLVDDLWEK